MIKLISKTSILALFMFSLALVVKAQVGYDFSHYEIGFGGGFDQASGDVTPTTTTQAVHLNLTYNTTPFVNIVFEAQLGKLAGGDSLTTATGRQFNNDFSAFILRGQLQFGEFLDYSHSQFNNVLKNLYIAPGIGFVVNHITQINRYSIKNPGVFTPGENNSMGPFIPLRLGYEFKLYNKYQQPSFKVDLAYEYNLVLNDNLDGFTSGSHFDAYTQFIIGVKFAFGGDIVSYRKQIHY